MEEDSLYMGYKPVASSAGQVLRAMRDCLLGLPLLPDLLS